MHGELYLNPAPGGSEYLGLGDRFYLSAPDEEGELTPCAVTRVGGTDVRPLLLLDLATSREQAIALQGRELLASGDALDAVPHYRLGDLIGMSVETAAGRPLGTIEDVVQTPAHELLEIRSPNGLTLLVPLVDELVTIDSAAAMARVVDGLLDEDAGA